MKTRGASAFSVTVCALSALCLGGSIRLLCAHPGVAGPGIFPAAASGVMLICALWQLFRPEETANEPTDIKRLAAALGLIALYAGSLVLGAEFYIASGLCMALFHGLLNGKITLKSLVYAAACLAAVFLIFSLGLGISFD